MPRTDLPLDELRRYRCATPEPAGLDAFWAETLAENDHPAAVETERVETGLRLVQTDDVSFAGFAGDRVRAWLHRPVGATGPLPTVVQFHGYSGGRGLAHEVGPWALAGWAHLTVDTRGQGWSNGPRHGTPDPSAAPDPHTPGSMTAGAASPRTHFYRRVYVDAVRALLATRELPSLDPERVVVTGGSQGGGISIAAAGLAPLVGFGLRGAMPDVPFLCDFRRALDVATHGPYLEITAYLRTWRERVEQTLDTLNHVDAVHLAARARCPALFSVGLQDTVCPPSTVFAAHAAWAGEKTMVEYAFNDHEGGAGHQVARQLVWAREVLEG